MTATPEITRGTGILDDLYRSTTRDHAETVYMQCDSHLRDLIERSLAAFEVRALDHGGRHAAAVAVAIAEEGQGANLPDIASPATWSTRASLILTRRAQGMDKHAGQWALPGGRIDAGETPEDAALRELAEEVGLHLDQDAVLGRLDDLATHSGFLITPVVVWAGTAEDLVPNAGEVASIHRIPVAEFMRDDAPILEAIEDSLHPTLCMPIGQDFIAAPTAAVLYQFREVCIAGRPTRVAHFEQPLFARR